MHRAAFLPGWFAAWFPLLFPLWFCFVTFVISRFGWAGLARAYPAAGKPTDAVSYRWRGGVVGNGTQYRGCLNVSLSHAGIYVVPSLLFRCGHSPLLLPWSGVESPARTASRFFGQVTVCFADQAGRKIKFFLPDSALPDLRALGGRGD